LDTSSQKHLSVPNSRKTVSSARESTNPSQMNAFS